MAALTSLQKEKKVLNPSSVLSTDKKHVAKRSRASSTEKNKSSNTSQTTKVAEGTDDIFRTHICSECRRCFKTRSHLKEHMRLHFPDPSLQCPTCKHFFTSKSKLRVHMLRETGQKLHQCHLCDYGAVERNPLLRHLASVHGHQEDGAPDRELFKCPSCPKEFSQSKALKSHMKTHNKTKDGQSLLCFQKNCSFECTDKKTFQKHTIDAHLIKAVECRHHACCSFFGSFEDMETHFRTHQAYHCQHCDFSCSNKNRLQQHMRQGHPGKKELKCSFCSFSTLNPVEFDQHVGHFHANEKTHCCTQCSFETAHKRVLKRHMLKHLGEKPHKCPQCDFRCRDETYLSKHMLTHSNVKQHMCSECGYVTKWKHYLTIHMRKHAGDLRYSCTQCPYRCHRIDQLNSHKLRHQEKSLICEVCAYSCKRKTELRNHMRLKHSTNADQQPPVYHCKFCPYTTKNRQALRTHENCKHTRARVFRCVLCRYTTFSNTGLFLHKKKAHGYVPGDVKWVEMYAAKEREQNSSNLTPNFYSNPAEHQAPSKHRTAICRTQQPHTVDVSQISINQNQCETISEIIGGSKESNPQDHTNTESPVKEAPTKVDQASPALAWYCSPGGQVKALIRNNNQSSIQTLDDHNTVSDNESVTEDSVEEEEMLPSNTTSSSDFQLQLMRRQDKDQAEALILEGKVQMLIVQTQTKTFHCDLCSYVTKKHEALLRHCKSSCRAMKASLRCRDCGMQFKQQRSLHTHRLKKCKKLSETMGRCRPSRTIEGSRVEDNGLAMSRKQDSTELDGPASLGSAEDETRSEGRLGAQGTSDSGEMFDHTDEGGCSGGNRSFSSTREGTMAQHSADSHTSIQSTATIAHDASNDSGQDSMRDPNQEVSKGHEEKSCLKPAEKPNDKCSVVTKSQRSLRRCTRFQTKETHFKSRNLQCDLCSFTCKQERSLTQHVAVKHNGVLPHQCRFCSFGTTRRYQLEAHESGHTGIGRHCCKLCDQTFGTRSRLRLHHQRIHDKQPTHFCSLCDYSAYSVNDISRHNLKCHTGEVHHQCDKCSAHFSTQTALKHHCGRAHPEDQGTVSTGPETHQGTESDPVKDTPEKQTKTSSTHRCKICSFTTNKKLLLVQHVMDEHENGQQEPSLKCDICGFSCAHQVVFNQHVRSHGGTCVFKCTECTFTTRNKQKITWHIRIHTGEKPYRCEKCDYACVDPSRLKYHMRIHTEERKYLCPECGFKCKWVNQLKHHMMKHTGAKPYSCGDCEYRTTRADALRIHVETRHREVRSFICEQCGKAFKLRFLLKMHQRKHSEERPYVCSICSSAFRWPAGLRNHHLNHTNQLPFHCRHCPYRARQKFQVVKHLKKYHPDVPVEDGVEKEQPEAAHQVWTGEEHHGDGEAALENLQAS